MGIGRSLGVVFAFSIAKISTRFRPSWNADSGSIAENSIRPESSWKVGLVATIRSFKAMANVRGGSMYARVESSP